MKHLLSMLLCIILLSSLTACAKADETPAAAIQAAPADTAANTDISAAATTSVSTDTNTQEGETGMIHLLITINNTEFTATLEDKEASSTLADRLPLTLSMNELNGNEKYNYLSEGLPADSETPGQILAGDIMLYGSDCLVLFYKSFSSSYSYTKLGTIDDPSGLAEAVGTGNVSVTFAITD